MDNTFQTFHITTKALIFHKNKFLLTKSNSEGFVGALECPGGRVNEKENLEDVLFRELREELNVDLKNIPHSIELFDINQRDEVSYDWEDKFTQIIEIYYKVFVPDDFDFKFELLQEASGFIWIDKNTNFDDFSYRVMSRKEVYKKAQKNLI
ncbi:MAG: NUDIX domain-containing protein [Patescibacteria group bacterium]|nr:NUDIX domain-containing protein [Patescibacteria group bacterium]